MIPDWANNLITIYFKQRPADITQKIYKRQGFKPFEYWYHELEYILNLDIECNEAFCNELSSNYLKDRYGMRFSIKDITSNDRQYILEAFYTYLNIESNMFPYNENDIQKKYEL
jgi:hypothetical protein